MAQIEARGVRFHYQRLGKGPQRVVFLHGFVWDNLSSWYFSAAAAVARSAEVLLYDLRGHGQSERPASGYTLQDMVADLHAILLATGFAEYPVHVVGNSFGGMLALAYAAAHPDRVASLVLVDGHVADETWGDEFRDILRAEGRERDRKIIESFHQWAGRHNDPRNTRLAQAAELLVKHTSLMDDLTRPYAFSQEDIERIRCPVLAIYGEHSDIRHKGERLAGRLADCKLEILPGGSHVILLEHTAMVRDRIIRWLGERAMDESLAGQAGEP